MALVFGDRVSDLPARIARGHVRVAAGRGGPRRVVHLAGIAHQSPCVGVLLQLDAAVLALASDAYLQRSLVVVLSQDQPRNRDVPSAIVLDRWGSQDAPLGCETSVSTAQGGL